MEQHARAALVLEVRLHLEAVDVADIFDGEVERHFLARLHPAIAIAADVVGHLKAVSEPRIRQGLDRRAHLDGPWGMPVRLFELYANRIGAIHHVARNAADALVILGNAVTERRRPGTRLSRVKPAKHQLTPLEPRVVASGRCAQLIQGLVALIGHLDAERQRAARTSGLVPRAGRGDDANLAGALVGTHFPVDSELRKVSDDLLGFLLLHALDERLGRTKHLKPLRRLGVEHEAPREPNQEVLLVLVFLLAGLCLGQALAQPRVQIVAHDNGRTLRIGGARVREMGLQIALAKKKLVDLQVHVLFVDRHRADRDVGNNAHALNRNVAWREVLRHGELQR